MFKRYRKDKREYVSPEEVFLDTKNLPGFDVERFEGRLERPISKFVFAALGVVFAFIGGGLFARAAYLGFVKGDEFTERARNNHLRHLSIVPPRGIIYDRNLQPLAFNVPGFKIVLAPPESGAMLDEQSIERLATLLLTERDGLAELIKKHRPEYGDLVVDFVYDWETANEIITAFKNEPRLRVEPAAIRSYDASPAFSHILGYMSKVRKEDIEKSDSRFIWPQTGRTGIELLYDEMLRGALGKKIVESDSEGNDLSEHVIEKEMPGKNLVLSISADLQNVMYKYVEETVKERGFKGGSAVMLDIKNGEVLGIVSYPGFDPNIISRGGPVSEVQKILESQDHPLFNRAISGLYPPASTIKPFIAAAANEEHVISPEKELFTNGKITVPNPYNPDNPSVFLDWKDHGYVDMYHAIAVSSNAYFFTIGGGHNGIEGLGLSRIHKYLKGFGLGNFTGIDLPREAEGILPDEEWKKKENPNDPVWRLGDTYNISIGQGGTLVTPLQMARALASLVNGGEVLKPQVLIGTADESGNVEHSGKKEILGRTLVSSPSSDIVKRGMRLAVEEGTARGVSTLPMKVGAKTGTGEYVKRDRVHSWFMGFAPYDNPRIALVVQLENGSEKNLVGGTYVANKILYWFIQNQDKVIQIDKTGGPL